MSLGLEFRSLRLQPTSSLLSLFWLAFEDGHSQHPAPDCCCLSCLYSAITDSYFSGAFSHKQTNKNFCNFPWSWGVITEQKSSYYIFILIYLFICLFICLLILKVTNLKWTHSSSGFLGQQWVDVFCQATTLFFQPVLEVGHFSQLLCWAWDSLALLVLGWGALSRSFPVPHQRKWCSH